MPDRTNDLAQALAQAVRESLAELSETRESRLTRGIVAGLTGALDDFERGYDAEPPVRRSDAQERGEILRGMQLLARSVPRTLSSRSYGAMCKAQNYIRDLLRLMGTEYTSSSHRPGEVLRPPDAGDGRPWILRDARCVSDGNTVSWHLLWYRSRREIDVDGD
jgi:hypothetical protein